MYYIVSLPEKNGLEVLSPHIYLQLSGMSNGYIDYSHSQYLVNGFVTFEEALTQAEKIFNVVLNLMADTKTHFTKGIYVIDGNTKDLSIDLTDYFLNIDDESIDMDILKGEIK